MTASGAGRALLGVVAFAAGCWILRETAGVVLPFLVALFLMLFSYPIVQLLAEWRVPRWLSSLALAITATGLLFGLGWLVTEGVIGMVETVQKNQERIDALWKGATKSLGVQGHLRAAGGLAEDATKRAAGVAAGMAGSMLSLLLNLMLVALYLAFLYASRPSLPERLQEALGKGRSERVIEVVQSLERESMRYFGLRTVVSLATALGFWAILALYGVESALLWGVISFVSQYVPYVGPVAATVFPVGMALLQFPSPWTAMWISIWLVAWSILMGNVVEAQVMARGMKLSPVMVLLALAFFSWMWGIAGVFLAVPILVALRLVLQQIPSARPAAELMGRSS